MIALPARSNTTLSRLVSPGPENLQKVQKALSRIRASGLADDLELRLNRAAEIAAPKGKDIFWQAITDMTLRDVREILNGPKDAATQYFRGETTEPLVAAMSPIVDGALADAGAIQAYDRMIGQYDSIPFVPDVKSDLTSYVLEKALDAVFLFLARGRGCDTRESSETEHRIAPARVRRGLVVGVAGSR